jgi:hypothetical protein
VYLDRTVVASQPLPPTWHDWLMRTRVALVMIGLIGIVVEGLLSDGAASARLATMVLVSLATATAIAWTEASQRLPLRLTTKISVNTSRRSWIWAFAIAGSVSAVAVQSWFQSGSVIGTGDVAPPAGIAWIARVFSAWTWSGSDLGGPSGLEAQLPWAAVLASVHGLGGSAEVAQRVWYSVLFVGAAMSSLAFFYALGLRPPGAAIGSLAYVFSPFVVANVVPNPIYMAALAVMPALPAVVLGAARGAFRLKTAALLMAAFAPLLGYIYENPPLLGVVVLFTLGTPLLAAWLLGRRAGLRGALTLVTGLLLILVVSAYWIVPSILVLPNFAGSLASISSWSWTEGRATIRNALWLNNFWGWQFPEYVPYSSVYDSFPFALLKFLPAALAFGAIAHRQHSFRERLGPPHLRLAVLMASIALVLILLSTGTNPPGDLIFNFLYALPYGWLLREPGRFLIAADLMYAVLIALTVEWLLTLIPRRRLGRGTRSPYPRTLVLVVLGVLVITPGLPLLTGAVIPDVRPVLPSAHVKVPNYWMDMTSYIDRVPVSGSVLVFPPDDFYQMPYRWGYYGVDDFIRDMMTRPVLTPSAQSYLAVAPQLRGAVDLTAGSMLAGNWPRAEGMMRLLGAPLVLVRGDLDTSTGNRSFLPPGGLSAALVKAPNFDLIHTSGPLQLFALRGLYPQDIEVSPYYATVNTTRPDLRILTALPQGAALVFGPAHTSTPSILELPLVSEWQHVSGKLTWDVVEPQGWTFTLHRLDLEPAQQPVEAMIKPSNGVTATLNGKILHLAVAVNEDLANGDFHAGSWGPVGDCANFGSGGELPDLQATVESQGGPSKGAFLRLSARAHSACVSQPVSWHGGALLFRISVRNISGALPRICLWETGPERCAAVSLPSVRSNSWSTYTSTVVPDAGTKGLALFLYSDVFEPGTSSQNDYADGQILEAPSFPTFALVGTPVRPAPLPRLMIHRSTYSKDWQGPDGSQHVVVDGLMNGWLVSDSQSLTSRYLGDDKVRAGFLISAAGLCASLILVLSLARWRVGFVRRPRSSNPRKN